MVLRFALDWIVARLRHSVLFALLIVFSIEIIVFSEVIMIGYSYGYTSADRVMRQGIGKTGVIRIENYYSADFYEELMARPEVAALGSTGTGWTDALPELYGIQKGHLKGEEGYLQYEMVSRGAANLCEIRLKEGTLPEELSWEGQGGKNTEYLYLGAGFADIPVGTVYESQYTTYMVAGILDKSQRWIDHSLKRGFEMQTLDYTFDCNYRVLAITDIAAFSSDVWICASDGYTMEQAAEQAFQIAKKHGADMRYTSLQTYYENTMGDMMTLKAILSKLVVIVCFSCAVMLVCLQLLQVLSLEKEFGVMYAVGFSQSEIWGAMVLKNILMAIVAFLMTVPILTRVMKWWFGSGSQTGNQRDTMLFIMTRYALPTAAAVILGVVLCSSLVVLVMLRKITPVQMIGGQE